MPQLRIHRQFSDRKNSFINKRIRSALDKVFPRRRARVFQFTDMLAFPPTVEKAVDRETKKSNIQWIAHDTGRESSMFLSIKRKTGFEIMRELGSIRKPAVRIR